MVNNRKQKRKNRKKIYIILIILAICINLIFVFISKKQSIDSQQEKTLLERYNEQNSEVVGVLNISDTIIDLPVVQTNDNSFYLNHNYMGDISQIGAIFLDKNVDVNNSKNFIIYGNSNGSFSELQNYTDENFYNSHQIIKLNIADCEKSFIIISVFEFTPSTLIDSNLYINFSNEQDYINFLEKIKKRTIFQTGLSTSFGDNLLTLSTVGQSSRLVIVAKQIN